MKNNKDELRQINNAMKALDKAMSVLDNDIDIELYDELGIKEITDKIAYIWLNLYDKKISLQEK